MQIVAEQNFVWLDQNHGERLKQLQFIICVYDVPFYSIW